jgi:membrane protein
MRFLYGHGFKRFVSDLRREISEDNVPNGAAALAFYLMLAIFPAMIFLLGLLPYLPIPDLDRQILDLIRQGLPEDAARLFGDTVRQITTDRQGGLLSLGALLTLWAASSGTVAIMQQLNITYDVVEGRPFWKVRAVAVFLTFLFGALLIGALGLIVAGDKLGLGRAFEGLRWGIILAALILAFESMYYFGPDVEQEFRFITPGSVLGVALLVLASLGFKFYVSRFSDYDATYGSLGAVIVFMLWLDVMGLVILLGSEINALIEHYAPEGKAKGQKEPANPAGLTRADRRDTIRRRGASP